MVKFLEQYWSKIFKKTHSKITLFKRSNNRSIFNDSILLPNHSQKWEELYQTYPIFFHYYNFHKLYKKTNQHHFTSFFSSKMRYATSKKVINFTTLLLSELFTWIHIVVEERKQVNNLFERGITVLRFLSPSSSTPLLHLRSLPAPRRNETLHTCQRTNHSP